MPTTIESMQPRTENDGGPLSPTALVTGATAGIGESVARGLAQRGWRVLVHGRTPETAAAAVRRLGAFGDRCVPIAADLEALDNVADLTRQVRVHAPSGLAALVNNAGAAFPARRLSSDGVERTIAVNHLAAAALTVMLEPLLRKSDVRGEPARVVMVTSYLEARAQPVSDWTYAKGWGQLRAYAYSKLANLAFAYLLARQWSDEIGVYMVDPGGVRSNFQRRAGGPLRAIGALGGAFMSSPQEAARGVVDAVALAPIGPTGSYIRAGRVRTSSKRSRDPEFQSDIAQQTNRLIDARQAR
ncbi:SDR family NAD(P)-dependent oxidoreductase [Candidatus Mycolicibacterium alkanivorans]|uniref:SDR family NAD(P)-dependent oxidoreductase n=1 Tax=Candidatus Mycolicibacterium alkanivorans TaxID=2954114 RepID=A0ABS9YUB2_9MYCO|nr:SDR family NAD(P)-dependent oxidoreductase [Candidatus Mycolicibacterium alkanivorans]MCI4674804.1 SDR family NAD(P)-dependent oxidoreductase [Candidatus Mycolicibacterium alkanivorans]